MRIATGFLKYGILWSYMVFYALCSQTALINPKRNLLDVPLALPAKLDSKGTALHNLRFPGPQEFARLCGGYTA